MAQPRSHFVCQSCGAASPRWAGRCPQCLTWHSLVEETLTPKAAEGRRQSQSAAPAPIVAVSARGERHTPTGIGELDRVLGGGVVEGSVVLVGGDPGIGKSTLMLQMCQGMARQNPVLYISGEEAPHQIRMRAERLGALEERLLVLGETQLENMLPHIVNTRPAVVVVDSIQTTFTARLDAAPGSVSQIREVAARLLAVAKGEGIPMFLVGHVTKEGAIAGPRVLEHMVDTVLYFEGERSHTYRILRSVKNRFGAASEIGVFEMHGTGLAEVESPSAFFLAERPAGATGSVVVASVTGSRPILVELQALVCPTPFGTARRTAIGVDQTRLGLLLAVLEKRAGILVADADVFVNVVGGIRLDEPAVDLGLLLAVASSHREVAVPADTLVLGEVGLAGEVRAVHNIEIRLREAAKLGFTRFIVPAGNARALTVKGVTGVASVQEAIGAVLS